MPVYTAFLIALSMRKCVDLFSRENEIKEK